MTKAQHIVLTKRPSEGLSPNHFALTESTIRDLSENEFLIKNKILSLDAGFRQWMNEGASDNYLSEMPLDEPVQSIILGEIIESKNPNYPVGVHVVGRTSWESHSIADGSDLMTIIDLDQGIAPEQFLSALGPSGMTAYFGLTLIGKPKAGDVLLVSAAAGGVGSLVGQLGKIFGCTTIGISSSEEKCQWLKQELGYDFAINYKQEPGLDQQLSEIAPNGIDIYYDNVGGQMLDTALNHLALNARVILCGAISQYGDGEQAGIKNLWQLVTKRANAQGFMFSDYVEQYPEAAAQLGQWIANNQLKAPLDLSHGIEKTAEHFCKMLNGKNLGKSLVIL